MNVIRLHIHLYYFQLFFLLDQFLDCSSGIFSHLVGQYSIPIFWTKHQMIFTLVNSMRLFSESFAHSISPRVVDTSREIHFSLSAVSPHCLVKTTARGSGLLVVKLPPPEAVALFFRPRCLVPE